MENIKRCEQLEENTWNLELIYKNIDEYNQDEKIIEDKLNKLESFKGIVLNNSTNLLECLNIDTEINRLMEKMANYAYRKYDEDISNTTYQELRGRFDSLYEKYSTISSYIIPELLKSDYSKIEDFIKENNELERYRLLLERIFRYKEYTLSENEEKIISNLTNSLTASQKIAGILRDSEMDFGEITDNQGNKVKLNNENYSLYIKDKDRKVRKNAFLQMFNTYGKYKNTLSECMNNFVGSNCKINKLKNYNNSRFASLYANRVDEKIYDNLVNVVNNRLSVIYRYFDLKKRVLNLDELNLYDTYVNLSDVSDKKYSYEEAKQIVLDVVSILGEDYKNKINETLNNRSIDIYPNEFKRSGAYSSGSFDTLPYILLNYQGTYHDVSTLIHELGHSMHSLYSIENNDYLYYSYKIFVAEVASIVNEMLLNYYMLDKTDDKTEKKYILSEMMDNFKATLYRQTMFAEFEQMMYSEYEKGTILTSEFLNNKYLEINKKYFGNDVNVNEEIKYEWMRIPHFYYNFYVYQYATGLASACYIVKRILNNEENAVNDYLNFLKSGDSLDPVDALKLAGVDISNPEVINSSIDMFDEIITEFENLI